MKRSGSHLALCCAAVFVAACTPAVPDAAPILLFTGPGTSPNDVIAVESLLHGRNLHYATATSAQINRMSASRLSAYRLLIVPGGNFVTMGKSLTAGATANIHNAVQGGLNYLGLCAGGLLAGKFADFGFDLAEGTRFPFYGLVSQDVHKAAVLIRTAGAPAMEHYWEDGPQLTGWGAVVARYPDDTPAVVEGHSGRGWVILTGIHPEAPESWRRGMTFTTPASAANAWAGTIIDAALNGAELPHY